MKLTAIDRSSQRTDIHIESDSPQDTAAVAAKLASLLGSGDILALYGELGAGKTVFSKGLAEALGITEDVTSPTFTFVSEYIGKVHELFHFDLYRIDFPEQLEDIGFDGYVFGTGISLIEWPERAGRYLPDNRLDIIISRCESGADIRKIVMSAQTDRYKSILEEFEKSVSTCD